MKKQPKETTSHVVLSWSHSHWPVCLYIWAYRIFFHHLTYLYAWTWLHEWVCHITAKGSLVKQCRQGLFVMVVDHHRDGRLLCELVFHTWLFVAVTHEWMTWFERAWILLSCNKFSLSIYYFILFLKVIFLYLFS